MRWLTGPVGRELVELAGPMDAAVSARARPHRLPPSGPALDDAERHLLQLLTEGRTNAEIAIELAVGEDDVAQRLARLQARLGTSSRAEATSPRVPRPRRRGLALMAIRARVDRHKCVGAGNCITLAPTAFDWLAGDYGKSDVVGADSIDEEVLRAAAFSCPTAAIILEDVAELLPWQLRGKAGAGAGGVLKTFMFTDIVGSTNLVEALGDEAWETMLRWHNSALREVFTAQGGEEIRPPATGSSSASTHPTLPSRRRSRSSGGLPSTVPHRASRRGSGSDSMPRTRPRSRATSTARASTRRRGSPRSAAPATSWPARPRPARRIEPRTRGAPPSRASPSRSRS